MKKITLSAAILALAMMGCSDAGLDNSVASTNEVKKEAQNQNFLAKNYFEQGLWQGMVRHEYPGFAIDVNTYAEGAHGVGAYSLAYGPVPTVANVLTVAVAYCEFDANATYGYSCAKHSADFVSGIGLTPIDPMNPHSSAKEVETRTSNLNNVPVGGIATVTAVGVVWNQGAPNEDVFGVTHYSGPLNDYTAGLVYQKYLLQAQDNIMNNRCIDWMPGQNPCYYHWH